MKRPYRRSFATLIEVNRQFLGAALCAGLAYVVWPTNPEWWGFAFLSILFGLGALQAVVNALRAMMRSYDEERAIAAFEAMGENPKSSRLATTDKLRKAGMLDG